MYWRFNCYLKNTFATELHRFVRYPLFETHGGPNITHPSMFAGGRKRWIRKTFVLSNASWMVNSYGNLIRRQPYLLIYIFIDSEDCW